MKAFLAIVGITPTGRVAKFQDFDTKKEADAHVAFVKESFPDAFSAPNPGGGFADWRITGKAVTIDPTPVVSRPPRFEDDAQAIQSASTLAGVKAAVAELVRKL